MLSMRRRHSINLEGMHKEYAIGTPNPESIALEGYTLDAALMARPGNVDIQLDLFLDDANKVKLYPSFQEYLRKWKPPLLAIWGKHDLYFIRAGAEAFRRDNPNATVQFLDRDISPSKRTLRKLLSRCGVSWEGCHPTNRGPKRSQLLSMKPLHFKGGPTANERCA